MEQKQRILLDVQFHDPCRESDRLVSSGHLHQHQRRLCRTYTWFQRGTIHQPCQISPLSIRHQFHSRDWKYRNFFYIKISTISNHPCNCTEMKITLFFHHLVIYQKTYDTYGKNSTDSEIHVQMSEYIVPLLWSSDDTQLLFSVLLFPPIFCSYSTRLPKACTPLFLDFLLNILFFTFINRKTAQYFIVFLLILSIKYV